MDDGCGKRGASQSGVLAPPSCGVARATARRSSLRLPLWLAPRSPRFVVHLGSASYRCMKRLSMIATRSPRWFVIVKRMTTKYMLPERPVFS